MKTFWFVLEIVWVAIKVEALMFAIVLAPILISLLVWYLTRGY